MDRRIAWEKIKRVFPMIELLAVGITAIFVGFQTKSIADHTKIFADHTKIFTELARTVLKHYEGSLDASLADRTSGWANRITEDRVMAKWTRIDKFLGKKESEAKKIERIERDQALKNDIHAVMALLEELGYFYNSNKLDKEFVRRTSSGPIIHFYDQVRFWIEYRRRQVGERSAGKDLEDMAEDLRKHARERP